MNLKPAAQYLPHHSPMILIDKIVSIHESQIICSVVVSNNGILTPFLNEHDKLPSYYFIEMMAQTIGIWNGVYTSHPEDKPKIAFLLGSRLFERS